MFVPFLPPKTRLVAMSELHGEPWKTPIYFQHISNRVFVSEFSKNIGEFKLCIQHENGDLEWESRDNRKIKT